MFRTTEQAEFKQIVTAHLAQPDGPLLLEGATGLGKTRAYLAAVFESQRRIGICLATNQLVNQLLDSSDMALARETWPSRTVAVFRSRKYFTDDTGQADIAALEAQRAAAGYADILICTASSVIFDQRLDGRYNGVTTREAILFDEADQIPGLAALASDLEINRQTLQDLSIKGDSPGVIADRLLAQKRLDPELRAKAKIIQEITASEPVWYREAGMTETGGVAVRHRLPGRLLKKIANRSSTIFVSATLSVNRSFNDFKRAMGLSVVSELSGSIEPREHGRLYFSFSADHPVNTGPWMDAVVDEIIASDSPTLVATPSHELARQLGERVPSATVRHCEETTTEAVARMGNAQILVSAGAWAGMDTPVTWKTVIIPKIPFLRPNQLFDRWEEDDEPDLRIGNEISSYLDSRNAAARRMVQVMGRGLRSPDAVCAIVICDPRVSQLGDIVPPRFHEVWHEGRSIERKITTSERNPRLRKDALRHYGVKCMACGHDPLILREVEVHHLNPLADHGPTATQLDDVAVLCRICHARAHKNGNDVIPVKRLAEIATQERDPAKRRRISFS